MVAFKFKTVYLSEVIRYCSLKQTLMNTDLDEWDTVDYLL